MKGIIASIFNRFQKLVDNAVIFILAIQFHDNKESNVFGLHGKWLNILNDLNKLYLVIIFSLHTFINQIQVKIWTLNSRTFIFIVIQLNSKIRFI